MKIKTMLLAATLTLGSLITAPGLANSSAAGAQQKNGGNSTTPPRTVSVPLQCRNYGGQQDVSKNPDIINPTHETIPSGRTLYWKASDGDKGSVADRLSLLGSSQPLEGSKARRWQMRSDKTYRQLELPRILCQ